MTDNLWANEPLNFSDESKTTKPERRTKYPWELLADPDFVKKISKHFLVDMFDPSWEPVHGNNLGYEFKSNGKTYSLRSRCLGINNKSWTCAFGNSNADNILFFGFRDLAKPNLEFCLDIPREKFRDRNKINISNDGGYHIKGYLEFWIDSDKFQKMLDFMTVVYDQDVSKVEEFFPRYYKQVEGKKAKCYSFE